MAAEPLTQSGFDNAVNQLKHWVAELAAVIEAEYPPGTVYDPDVYPAGSSWDGSTGVIRKRIGEVIEAFSALQEALGLPLGELSMRQQRKADQEAAAKEPWPKIGSIRAEMVETMAAIVQSDQARARDRQLAAKIILQASHEDRMARLLEDSHEFYQSLSRRLDVLERQAVERKKAETVAPSDHERHRSKSVEPLSFPTENHPMATPKKPSKPKAAPAPSKKPAVIDRDDAPPSRQKPKQGGGADRPTRHG